MPKIFKQNKFALLGANILIILLWVTISSFLINLFQSENAPFYIYKISFLIRFLPPIWVTWFLWIKRGGLKRQITKHFCVFTIKINQLSSVSLLEIFM